MRIARPASAAVAPASATINTSLVAAFFLALLFCLAPAVAAQTFSLLYQFKSGPGGINPYAGVVLDASGNLYGTTYNDGALASGTVFKIDPTGKEAVLHSFSQFGGDGVFPWYGALAKDSSGNFYGTTGAGGPLGRLGAGTIFRVNTSGKETILL